MRDIPAPRTTAELASALTAKAAEIEEYFREVPPEVFVEPQGTYWSPEGHLKHLVKSVRPLAGALKMPKGALLLRFGPNLSRRGADGVSRSFEEVVAAYHRLLETGPDAGRFSPSPAKEGETPEGRHGQVLSYWRQASDGLDAGLRRWGETALDRLRLPHPLLGKLTVREMLFFTLYHNHHHLCRVQERAERPAG